MSTQSREVYASTNGDRWTLVRDLVTGDVRVQHRANLASGGHETSYTIGEFLSSQLHTPERQRLIEMIGSLVSSTNEDDRDQATENR